MRAASSGIIASFVPGLVSGLSIAESAPDGCGPVFASRKDDRGDVFRKDPLRSDVEGGLSKPKEDTLAVTLLKNLRRVEPFPMEKRDLIRVGCHPEH
jgi:hypothetical protein